MDVQYKNRAATMAPSATKRRLAGRFRGAALEDTEGFAGDIVEVARLEVGDIAVLNFVLDEGAPEVVLKEV